MKAVILAGGEGTRISEETTVRPKPMVEIGGRPILWHIMKIYSTYGINDFVVCCGYKGYVIKEYFANYFLHMSDVTFDLSENSMKVHQRYSEPWKITLVDTGAHTMTGGRLKKIYDYVKNEDDFCMTYGDGLSDVNISNLIKFHRSQNVYATLLAVQAPARYGVLDILDDKVIKFDEKPQENAAFINGGFFVLKPPALAIIDGDETIWERQPLQSLASSGMLACFKHLGFWHPMDTMRDKLHLERMWNSGAPPWKAWET